MMLLGRVLFKRNMRLRNATLEKNKSLIFARAFGDRRLGQAVSGAACRSEAMGSIPTRDFPPWIRGRTVSPSKVDITQRFHRILSYRN